MSAPISEPHRLLRTTAGQRAWLAAARDSREPVYLTLAERAEMTVHRFEAWANARPTLEVLVFVLVGAAIGVAIAVTVLRAFAS